jgi:hypothetical protein
MAYDSLFSKTPAIFADQYAFTMGAADFSAQKLARKSTSQIFFRQLIGNGFKNAEGNDLKIPYLVVGGLGPFIEWLDNWEIYRRRRGLFCFAEDGGRSYIFRCLYRSFAKHAFAHQHRRDAGRRVGFSRRASFSPYRAALPSPNA